MPRLSDFFRFFPRLIIRTNASGRMLEQSVSPEQLGNVSIAQSSQGVTLRTDRESSMLREGERMSASLTASNVLEHYKHTLAQKGGTDAVIQELINHLAMKVGNPQSADPRNPELRQGMDSYRTALRVLLDPKPNGALFENLLHSGTRSYKIEISGNRYVELRELLASYWLAAQDPSRIPNEMLDNIPGDDDEARRMNASHAEQELFITMLSDIRRAHNGDVGYKSADSPIDEPSCGPGTFGRLVKSPQYNALSKLKPDP